MRVAKKTTILFPPDLYDQLTHQARQLGVSLEELVRQACEAYYGYASIDERLEAVRRLEAMSLPVSEPDQMERESVPDSEDLLM